jgi:glyoxylate utilization-related uncharacterized protein
MDRDMKKLYAVITVARQIDGEYVFIKTEKAFESAQKADNLLKTLKNNYVTSEGKWKPQLISTAQGEATCQCEVGVFELELEENNE